VQTTVAVLPAHQDGLARPDRRVGLAPARSGEGDCQVDAHPLRTVHWQAEVLNEQRVFVTILVVRLPQVLHAGTSSYAAGLAAP
jgi:hypothetical protein